MQSPVCPEIRGRRDNRKRVTGSVDARGRAGRGKSAARIESRVRVPRVISHRRGRTARGNFTWNALVPLGDIALRGGRRGGQRGGGRAEREWVNVRPVGWFVRRREIVSRRNFSEGRAVFLSMLFLASASTDDSRRSSGRSASGPGRKAVSFIAGLLPPNRLLSTS